MAHTAVAAAAPPVLAPLNPPLGPQPPGPFYSSHQVTLRMKEKVWSLTGDDFTVQTIEDVNILKVKGKVISLHNKKEFTDMTGKEVFTLADKKLALFKSFHGEAPGGHNFEVKGKFSVGSSKSTVEFVNNSDRSNIELHIKGDWFDRSAHILLGERPVAHITRSFLNAREIFGSKQTYFVTVAPNVDLSLIAAICVCLDERENEK